MTKKFWSLSGLLVMSGLLATLAFGCAGCSTFDNLFGNAAPKSTDQGLAYAKTTLTTLNNTYVVAKGNGSLTAQDAVTIYEKYVQPANQALLNVEEAVKNKPDSVPELLTSLQTLLQTYATDMARRQALSYAKPAAPALPVPPTPPNQ